jgi:hypothetical protein
MKATSNSCRNEYRNEVSCEETMQAELCPTAA